MKSKAKWTYGRLQIRALLPTGRGLWPALWMVNLLLKFFTRTIFLTFTKTSYQKDKIMVVPIGPITVKLI